MSEEQKLPEVNLSDELPESLTPKPRESNKPYDPTRDREVARSRIATVLLGGFFLSIAAYLVAASMAGATFTELSSFFDKAFTALVGLVGTALGFYFGTRDR
jgi:hypothetical protein